jgi:tape measure domain-containing protein
MAFNLGDVFLTFKVKTDSLKDGVKEVKSTIDTTEKNVSKFSTRSAAVMGAVAGTVQSVFSRATDMIANSMSAAIKRVDTLKNANRTFENMGFGIVDVKQSVDLLKQSIMGLPTPLDAAIRGVQMLASSTGDIKKSQQLYSALNNAILGFGGTAEQVDEGVIQLSQDFANGRISGQTWLSMMNSGLGPALTAIAKEIGITTGQLQEGLSDGSISVEKFQDHLIKMNKEGGGGLKSFERIAKDSTAGIGTGFQNMQTAMTRGMAKIIEAVGPENISRAIAFAGKLFELTLGFVATAITKTIAFVAAVPETLSRWFDSARDSVAGFGRVLEDIGSGVITWIRDRISDIVDAWIKLRDTVEAVIKAIIGWLYDWRYWIQNISIVIGTILLPKIVAIGVAWTVAAAKAIASFTAMTAGATANAFMTSIAWIASASVTAFTWTVQTLPRLIAAFALMSFHAMINAAKVTAAFVLSSAQTLLSWGVTFAGYIAGLAMIVFQTTLAAGRLVIAWMLAMGPIGLIAALIVGLTALIVANWDTVKRHVAAGVEFMKKAVEGIGSIFSRVTEHIVAPFKMAFNAISRLWNASVGKLAFKAPDWVPGLGGKGWSMPQLPLLALGTPNWRGGIAGMNEFGKETAILPAGTRVLTAEQTARNESQGGNKYYLNMSGIIARSSMELADIMEEGIQALDRRRMGAGQPQILKDGR